MISESEVIGPNGVANESNDRANGSNEGTNGLSVGGRIKAQHFRRAFSWPAGQGLLFPVDQLALIRRKAMEGFAS